MKKFLLLIWVFISVGLRAQISYEYRTSKPCYLTKFNSLGYKYVEIINSPLQINIYNLNHTLNTNIVVPGTYTASTSIHYISDNLFDLDPGIEYVVNDVGSPTYNYIFRIYDQSGSVLMARDSGAFNNSSVAPNASLNTNHIFFDGINTRMRVLIQNGTSSYEYYTLPGSLPCVECQQGFIMGLSESSDADPKEAQFYPNPVSGYLKLKYQLPLDAKKAFIKVYDMTGRLVQDMEITDAFDNILLPEDYNNGLYLYSLVVDGVVIKNEKIILTK